MCGRRGAEFVCAALLLLAPGARAEGDGPIEEIAILAARLGQPPARSLFGVDRLHREALAASPDLRLDAILTDLPGVSLFRRAGSSSAHPTTQGLTLRALGPNGAGRALVLRDGVPLNDPFGGWVHWSAIDPLMLEEVRIEKGSGAGPYGNQALSGVVALESRPIARSAFHSELRGDSFSTFSLRGNAAFTGKDDAFGLRLSGRHFDSDGFRLLSADARGPVDVRAASGANGADLEAVARPDARTAVHARFGWFREERINGLALARNDTEGLDASVRLARDGGRTRPSFEMSFFWQRRDFANSFAAVEDAERSKALAVLDQVRVPATGFGGRALIRFPIADDSSLEAGVDARRLEGETNELFRNLGAGFTRRREAGGDQLLLGSWLELAARLSERLELAGGMRFDHWALSDGRLREFDRETGALLRDDAIRDRSGERVNGRIGLRWRPRDAIAVRISSYSGWRLATINELTRPFRVGNDITEANPDLAPERLFGHEAGIEYQPLASLRLAIGYYRARLEKAVGNVTLATGPGVFPPAGFVPDGGSLRMRRNIDLIRAQGVEFAGEMTLANGLSLELRTSLSGAHVARFDEAPDLIGKRLQQAPKQEALMVLGYALDDRTSWRAALRYLGARFEDDQNLRRIPDAAVLDLSFRYRISQRVSFELMIANSLDSKVISQIDGDGLAFEAEPRSLAAGLRIAL